MPDINQYNSVEWIVAVFVMKTTLAWMLAAFWRFWFEIPRFFRKITEIF